ncbi:unnamed protein product [Adineta ricciae]|uniref:Uncharacterized protein n=1 Tax=Adineta ricciae TaxID=249248 RepID=A0A814ZBR4_ADIRI|nr:unnamed protein product [Adineta ricciae]CAF1613968.1 unnamed protein product [Adineta ricciae]
MGQAYCSCPIPELYFPSFDQQVKILELQKDINEVFSYVVSITQKVGGQLGIPPQVFSLIGILSNQQEIKKALLWAKIEARLAETAVSQLNAKIFAIKHRLDILQNPNITKECRQLEIVPAIHSSDEILYLFGDKSYVFFRSPVATMPYLAAFLAVYNVILQIAIGIIPNSYGGVEEQRRKEEVRQLINQYKSAFWVSRFAVIETVTVGQGTEWNSDDGAVIDAYNRKEDEEMQKCGCSEGKTRYMAALRSTYEAYFATILQPF